MWRLTVVKSRSVRVERGDHWWAMTVPARWWQRRLRITRRETRNWTGWQEIGATRDD